MAKPTKKPEPEAEPETEDHTVSALETLRMTIAKQTEVLERLVATIEHIGDTLDTVWGDQARAMRKRP